MKMFGLTRKSEIALALLFRLAVIGVVLFAAGLLGAQQPQVSIEPKKDTIAEAPKQIVFGFSRVVMGVTALPLTSPPRAYCVHARLTADTLLVDPPVTEAEPLFPQCARSEVPLVIRPMCQLTYEERLSWVVKHERPVIFVCDHDGEPAVVLLTKPGYP